MQRQLSYIETELRKRLHENPDQVWLKFREDEYTWRQVISLSQRVANGLLKTGVKPNERVGIMARNTPEFLWTYFGALMAGAHIVPLNRWQRGPALDHMLGDSCVVALAIDHELSGVISEARVRSPCLKSVIDLDNVGGQGIDVTFQDLLNSPDIEPKGAVTQAGGAVQLLYTSGTTGPPKGIEAVNYEPFFHALLKALPVRAGETIYTCLPLFHANALMLSVIGSIRLNVCLALAERFSASQFWDDCRKYKAVETNALGAMIPILMKQPERPDDQDNPVKTVLSVGCPAATWREFERRFNTRIVEFYGMSDAVGFLLNLEGKVGAAGKPFGGAEYRIADEHDNTLPPGKLGQILFRHKDGQLTRYHNMPEATAKAYREGWFHSGDMGETDEEGFFYFRGRVKEAIRRRGENISAWEVEAVVDLHPKVLESAAFGVPSELGEEEVMIAVVPQPSTEITPAEILDFCSDKLARFAMPRYIEIVEALPKTATQKIQHNVLKDRGPSTKTWDREKTDYVSCRTQ